MQQTRESSSRRLGRPRLPPSIIAHSARIILQKLLRSVPLLKLKHRYDSDCSYIWEEVETTIEVPASVFAAEDIKKADPGLMMHISRAYECVPTQGALKFCSEAFITYFFKIDDDSSVLPLSVFRRLYEEELRLPGKSSIESAFEDNIRMLERMHRYSVFKSEDFALLLSVSAYRMAKAFEIGIHASLLCESDMLRIATKTSEQDTKDTKRNLLEP